MLTRRRRQPLLITFIVVALFSLTAALVFAGEGGGADAPEPALEAVAAAEGFSFRYPQAWTIVSQGGRSVTLASREGLPLDITTRLPENEIVLEVGINNEETILPADVDLGAAPSPLAILEGIVEEAPGNLSLLTPEALTIGGQEAAEVLGTAGANNIVLIVWRLDADTYGTIAAWMGDAGFTEYEATLYAIASSMTATVTPVTPVAPAVVTEQTAEVGPVAAARRFYNWYLGERLPRAEAELGQATPMPMDMMTDAMRAQIEAIQDPVVCGPGRPASVELFAAGQVGDEAQVVAHIFYSGTALPVNAQVDLIRVSDAWQVDSVACTLEVDTVAELVFARYAHFVQLDQRAGAADLERFADDWDFAWNRYVTTSLQQQQIALNQAEDLNFDPFLCTQDVPAHLNAEVVQRSDVDATVALTGYYTAEEETFTGELLLEAELLNTDDGWKVNVVSCVSH